MSILPEEHTNNKAEVRQTDSATGGKLMGGSGSVEGKVGSTHLSGTCPLSVSVFHDSPRISLWQVKRKIVKILTRQAQESPEEDKLHIDFKSLFKG